MYLVLKSKHICTYAYIYYVVPVIKITTAIVQCTEIYLSWANINSGRCTSSANLYLIRLQYRIPTRVTVTLSRSSSLNYTSFHIPDNTTCNVSVTSVTSLDRDQPISNFDNVSLTTPVLEGAYVHIYTYIIQIIVIIRT